MLASVRLGQAESALAAPFASFAGVAFYDEPVQRAAILASRIVRNHPLLDGNKRAALICMIELLARDGFALTATQDERAEAIERLASREVTEEEFVSWLRGHTAPLSESL